MKMRPVFLLTLMFLMTTLSLAAQVEWRGGFPGRETDWQCARNWSSNRVPNELDHVIIPDCSTRGNFYPEIRTKTAAVQSLTLNSLAHMKVTAGANLSVVGYGLAGGALLNLGTIENNGTIEVAEPILHAIEYTGNGTLIHIMTDLQPDICEVDCDLYR